MSPTESTPPMSQQPASDGIVDGVMAKIFGKSWKTTVAGLLTLACGVAPLIPNLPPVVHDICRVSLPILTGGGLMLSKDHNVSGGKKK